MASVVLVFGTPDGAQRKAGKALAGPVGDAAVKAVTALGFDPAALFAICSRPEPGIDAVALASRLELAIEAVDPVVVIALDEDASRDLSAAFGCAALAPGRPATVRGRTLGAVGDLRGSLHNAAAKRPVWAAFRAVHAAVPESLRPAAPSGSSPG